MAHPAGAADPALASSLITHLLALCFELAHVGGPTLPLFSALRHLSGYWPELLRPQLGQLAHLVPLLGESGLCYTNVLIVYETLAA